MKGIKFFIQRICHDIGYNEKCGLFNSLLSGKSAEDVWKSHYDVIWCVWNQLKSVLEDYYKGLDGEGGE